MKRLWKNSSMIWKILSILFSILLLACQTSQPEQKIKTDSNLPDEQSDSIKIYSTANNKIEWELSAAHIERFYDEQKVYGNSVFIKIYNQDNSITTIACNDAELDDIENILTGTGDVIVTSSKGILKTPYLIWDRKTDQLFAKEKVQLIREENVLYGEEMKTDLNLDRIEITKVSAEGNVNEEEFNW